MWAEAAAALGGWDAAHVDRLAAWYTLLHVDETLDEPGEGAMVPSRARLPPHRDEAQVALDVQRSLGVYKDTADAAVRGQRREQLEAVIVGTLRTYPVLHYYQGFHDIVSVLVLTLCPTLGPGVWPDTATRARVQHAVDQVSLHVVRDSMAANLQPVLGQLKVVRNIVRAADLPFALAIERVFAPSPMWVALPWVITLLTHELHQVQSAQRVLDYVLTHGPPSILYICAALLLAHQPTLGRLAGEGGIEAMDMPLLHHTLASLPPLDTDAQLHAVLGEAQRLETAYALTCPAVRAPTIVGEGSVVFTELPHWSSHAAALAYAALPPSRLALNVDTTPREPEKHLGALAKQPRAMLLRRLLPFYARQRALPYLLASTLSLFLGSSLLTLWFALQLAPR